MVIDKVSSVLDILPNFMEGRPLYHNLNSMLETGIYFVTLFIYIFSPFKTHQNRNMTGIVNLCAGLQ